MSDQVPSERQPTVVIAPRVPPEERAIILGQQVRGDDDPDRLLRSESSPRRTVAYLAGIAAVLVTAVAMVLAADRVLRPTVATPAPTSLPGTMDALWHALTATTVVVVGLLILSVSGRAGVEAACATDHLLVRVAQRREERTRHRCITAWSCDVIFLASLSSARRPMVGSLAADASDLESALSPERIADVRLDVWVAAMQARRADDIAEALKLSTNVLRGADGTESAWRQARLEHARAEVSALDEAVQECHAKLARLHALLSLADLTVRTELKEDDDV